MSKSKTRGEKRKAGDPQSFLYRGKGRFALARYPKSIDPVYKDKKAYKERLAILQKELHDLQNVMYAHDRYSVLLVFQAMDAAGKDGTIRRLVAGVDAHGVKVHSFKVPSAEERSHDFLWRTTKAMPRSGVIGIFNRSYYEEVLVCRVHPELVLQGQRLPLEYTRDLAALWERRYAAIRDFERHATENGTIILKFFLNVSCDEQRRRFLARIDEPDKNWKFEEGDVRERSFWNAYQDAYQRCIDATATADAPWAIIPADDKKSMRILVGEIVVARLKELEMAYPVVSQERKEKLAEYRVALESE
ncbi:polyphosphate kinase 2 family protein [soil metagenome]